MSVGKLPSRDQAIAESGHAGGDQTDSSVYSQVADLVARTRDDWRWAWQYFIFCSVAGSMWTPRVLRRLIYSLGGASIESAPAPAFVLAGSPKNLTIGSGVYMNRGVLSRQSRRSPWAAIAPSAWRR